MVINVSINRALDDSVIVKQLFMFRKIFTNAQMRIDFDCDRLIMKVFTNHEPYK